MPASLVRHGGGDFCDTSGYNAGYVSTVFASVKKNLLDSPKTKQESNYSQAPLVKSCKTFTVFVGGERSMESTIA